MDFIKREDSYASDITSLGVGLTRKKEWVIGMGEKLLNRMPRCSIYIPSRLRWFKIDLNEEAIPHGNEESTIE